MIPQTQNPRRDPDIGAHVHPDAELTHTIVDGDL